MKFDCEKPDEKDRECVAFLTHIEGEPDKHILCIKNSEGGRATWLYYDGEVVSYNWKPELATKKFYRGDTVTITF